MRTDILDKKEIILKMISENEPKAAICKILNCKPITLNNWLKKIGIEYVGNMGLKGKKISKDRISAIEYLNKPHPLTPKLRKKLIEDGIKKEECEMCGCNEWLGKKLTLELHHIDGNRFNNNIDNLQILCPNCHSLTPNHNGKIKSDKIKNIINVKQNYCECGKKIKLKSKQCVECYSVSQRKISTRPDLHELIYNVNNFGYRNTGLKYGVSDNTIRKWIKSYI